MEKMNLLNDINNRHPLEGVDGGICVVQPINGNENSLIDEKNIGTVDNECSRGRERNRRILHSFNASVLAKIVSVISMFISTPLAYNHLGVEQFGLWMTITSLLAVLQFADFGVGNGVLNSIAEARGQDDEEKAKRIVTSGLVLLTTIGVGCFLIFLLAFQFIDWSKVFNITSEITVEAKQSMLVFVVFFVISLPLLIVQRVQMGYQDGFYVHLWGTLGSILLVVGIFITVWLNASLPWLVLVVVGAPIFVTGLNWIFYFFFVKRCLLPQVKYFDYGTARHIFSLGIIWMMYQAMAFVGAGADNMIIGYLIGQDAVAEYAVMAKIQSSLLIAQMLSAPLWPAFADAVERGDVLWARKTFQRALTLSVTIGVGGALIILIFSKWIVGIWMGAELVPGFELILGFAALSIVFNLFSPMSAVMANNRFLRKLLLLTSIAALISFILKFILGTNIGISGIVWSTVIGYGLICVPTIIFIYCVILKPETNISHPGSPNFIHKI